MEMLVEYGSHPRDTALADQAFITGIMSMMPVALGLPMDEIFAQIALEPEVMQALSSHAGILGQTLALLECFDAEDAAGCALLLDQMRDTGIDRGQLNACLMEALRWVNGSDA
jgi:EAL and modified HD-GYP domain-containing signal transduction protein